MHNKSFPLRCPTYMKVSSSITPDQSLIRSCVETLINLDDLTNQPLLNCSQGQELGWSSSLQMQRWQLTWVLEVHLLLCCWFPPRVPTGPDTDKSAATEKWFDDEVITLYMYYYRWSMIKSTVVLSFDWPSLIHHFEAEWVLNGSVGVGAMMAAAVWDGSTNFVRMAFEYHLNHRAASSIMWIMLLLLLLLLFFCHVFVIRKTKACKKWGATGSEAAHVWSTTRTATTDESRSTFGAISGTSLRWYYLEVDGALPMS